MSLLHQTKKMAQKQKQKEKEKPTRLKNSAKLPKLSIQQQIDNNEVIERMNRKITFTKNPRHLGSTITYQQALNSTLNNMNPGDFQVSARNNNSGTVNNTIGLPKFRSIPQSILFNRFQPHHTYQSQIKLTNISNTIQRIKITPFSLKQFNIYKVQYPKQGSGDIAPGISVNIVIRFRPSNLKDLEEELIVIYNGGTIKIKIQAKREQPKIIWPKNIDCGHCWVGNKMKKQVNIYNEGGEAQYDLIKNYGIKVNEQQSTAHIGYFTITPTVLKFTKQSSQHIFVNFTPQTPGLFLQKVQFRSNQGQHQLITIQLKGGSYNAQIILESVNGEQIKQHYLQNNLYLNGTQVNKESKGKVIVRNLAVVDVEYFWYIQEQQTDGGKNMIQINNDKGKLNASSHAEFEIIFKPENRTPQKIKAELYLVNLPEKSLSNRSLVKIINGVKSIQCLVLNIKTRPTESTINIFPLHKQIVQKVYKSVPVIDYFTISNGSSSNRQYKISKISSTAHCNIKLICDDLGILNPKQQRKIQFSFQINQLTKQKQLGYYLIEFDNTNSKIFSVGGYVEYPEIIFSETQIYYGLCRTYTKIKKQLVMKNEQKSQVFFKVKNPIKYYELDFYDFYDFEEEENQKFKKRRFTIRSIGQESLNDQEIKDIIDDQKIYSILPNQTFTLNLEYSTMEPQNINEQFQIQTVYGKTKRLPITLFIQDIFLQLSRNQINLRQIYTGNVYNSNKFLSKQLSIQNKTNIQTAFEIILPNQEKCLIKIDPIFFTIPPKTKKRLDLMLEPIKTGEFYQEIKLKYYDDFKMNEKKYPELGKFIKYKKEEGEKSKIKESLLTLKGQIKGVQIKYLIKDQTRARRVRQKMEDIATSVKYSNKSFKSSKASLHQQQKLIYPFLQALNFYNCQVNQVKQMQIIIQNDSDLSAQYSIQAENYHTLQKIQTIKKNSKGLVGQEEEAFSSEMGKTFLQNRILDKSQKIHLSNNKGISIMCQPFSGILHKKQSQKITVTMFNDTSGRFKDHLIISVKNHEVKKFPIDIHIKGSPVLLSKNQLGINFNEEVPIMNVGSLLTSNGAVKKSIKVINKGPKQVKLNWKTYPYNQLNQEKDFFKIDFVQGAPGTTDLVEVKWNALQPQTDKTTPFIIQPRQKTLKGRQEFVFNLIVNNLSNELKIYENLMICQPQLQDGERKVKMQNLAVIVKGEAVKPHLNMDLKHKNHINKLQLFATEHILKDKQTNAHNNLRKLKLTNDLKANLQFQLSIQNKDPSYLSFKIVSVNTNSPINSYDENKTFIKDKRFILAYESFIEIVVELVANKKDLKEWPLEPSTRKQGNIVVKFSNGEEQIINLVGWLYRPWVQVQMPNDLWCSIENRLIDFGTIHIKNSRKMSIYLVNPSKSDAKFTITYIKYQQSKKIQFQQALWTDQDYEDLNITDSKDIFFLNQDQGTVLNRSIPVHYIPGTLALPSQQDQHQRTHKPIKIDFLFKPKSNILYKSKFRITFEDSIFYDVIVKGKGSFDQELLVK